MPAIGVWQNGLTYFIYHHPAADALEQSRARGKTPPLWLFLAYVLVDMTEPLERQ